LFCLFIYLDLFICQELTLAFRHPWLKNIFLSQYLFIAILCVKMSHVNNSPNFNIKIFFIFQLLFDKEFESNPIEKIKVISSTYMAACGLLPGRNSSLETPASAFNEPFTRFDQGIDPTEHGRPQGRARGGP